MYRSIPTSPDNHFKADLIMNKIYQTLLVCLIFQVSIAAQQLPLFTQYRQNIGVINPAGLSSDFMVFDQHTTFVASIRRQWVGFDNPPTTQLIQGSYLYDGDGISLLSGGYLINDQTGPTGFTGLYGRVATIFSDDIYDHGISVGFNIGLVQYRVNITDIEFLEADDILITEDQTRLFPDVGFGAFAYKRFSGGFLDDTQLYGGVSVPQLIGLDLEFKDNNGEFFTRRVQHFYGIVGLIKYLDDDKFIEPSVWAKYTFDAKINIDFNLRYKMAQNFWLGAGGSTAGAAHVEAGILVGEYPGSDNTFTIGYGFDYFFATFGPEVGTSHEFNIFYSF